MRRFFLPWLLLLAACGQQSSTSPTGKNENTDYLVSLEGIGPVKTGMSQAQLEQLLGKKIPLTNPTDTISGSWMDSARVQYKEAELALSFVRSYAYEKPDSFHMRVESLLTRSPLCTTAEGIGIGSTRQQVLRAFENNTIYMGPEYDNDTTVSKTRFLIHVREFREGPQIVFHLLENKVVAIEVGSYYDDEE